MPRRWRPKKLKVATTQPGRLLRLPHVLPRHRRALFKLLELVEFDRSPLTDIKHCGPCDIGLIEGGLCNAENVHVLREFRKNCKILVAIGACAINGGLPASATTSTWRMPRGGVPHRTGWRTAGIPNDPELPLPLDKVHPIHEVVKVDYFLPGCPPSADAIWKFLTDLHRRRTPSWDTATVCCTTTEADMSFELETTQLETPETLRRVAIDPGVARRGPRQGHPARRRQPGAAGAPAHRRIPRLREIHPGPAVLGSAGHGAAPVRHLPGVAPPGRVQGAGPDRRRGS
jgi:NAD-reducing hydrogenase small subunit